MTRRVATAVAGAASPTMTTIERATDARVARTLAVADVAVTAVARRRTREDVRVVDPIAAMGVTAGIHGTGVPATAVVLAKTVAIERIIAPVMTSGVVGIPAADAAVTVVGVAGMQSLFAMSKAVMNGVDGLKAAAGRAANLVPMAVAIHGIVATARDEIPRVEMEKAVGAAPAVVPTGGPIEDLGVVNP